MQDPLVQRTGELPNALNDLITRFPDLPGGYGIDISNFQKCFLHAQQRCLHLLL
ncbi:hypothetical protein D3C79_1061070 [compost metagenome]